MKFFMNSLNSTNKTFVFYLIMLGKNMNYIMWKYDVPPKMCRGTYVAINKLKTDDTRRHYDANDSHVF